VRAGAIVVTRSRLASYATPPRQDTIFATSPGLGSSVTMVKSKCKNGKMNKEEKPTSCNSLPARPSRAITSSVCPKCRSQNSVLFLFLNGLQPWCLGQCGVQIADPQCLGICICRVEATDNDRHDGQQYRDRREDCPQEGWNPCMSM